MRELPVDAEGFDVLPCGCRMKTAMVGGKPTFVFNPHALDCDFYLYVQREGARQGKPTTVVDMREPGPHGGV